MKINLNYVQLFHFRNSLPKMATVDSIWRFYICNFSYAQKCICNTKISTHRALATIHGHAQNRKEQELANMHVHSWGQQNDIWPCFSPHARNKCLFHSVFCAKFLTFFFFALWVILAFKMAPQYSVEVLSSS